MSNKRKIYEEMSDDELAAIYCEKTEQIAQGLRVMDKMMTIFGKHAVLREIGQLENELLEVLAVMQMEHD